MNLLQLKYFQEVAKYQNITRTAEILHVSQPSLSTAIRHLEEELGIELFDQKGKSIVLNENGQNFLRDINSMFELLNRNQQNRNRLASGKTQKIYIGGEKSELKLSAFIARFLDRYPDVLISFKNAVSMTSLNPEILDFFILAEEPGSHPGPRLILDHEKHCILMSSHHPLAECSSVTLDMLKDETFVFVTPNANILPPGYRICEKAGFLQKLPVLLTSVPSFWQFCAKALSYLLFQSVMPSHLPESENTVPLHCPPRTSEILCLRFHPVKHFLRFLKYSCLNFLTQRKFRNSIRISQWNNFCFPEDKLA